VKPPKNVNQPALHIGEAEAFLYFGCKGILSQDVVFVDSKTKSRIIFGLLDEIHLATPQPLPGILSQLGLPKRSAP
jgi:hypothetical protein